MTKFTKRTIDSAKPGSRDSFLWDSELRGFGVRVKPSGTGAFIIQCRNIEGRSRRCVIGQYGILTVEQARPCQEETGKRRRWLGPSCRAVGQLT
jgi:Arm DNA-binding domain